MSDSNSDWVSPEDFASAEQQQLAASSEPVAPSALQDTGNFLTGVGQGATLGFADEAAGLVGQQAQRLRRALTGDYATGPGTLAEAEQRDYTQTRDIAREQQAQAAERSPYLHGAGQFVGGAAALPTVANPAGMAAIGAGSAALNVIGRSEGDALDRVRQLDERGTEIALAGLAGYGGAKLAQLAKARVAKKAVAAERAVAALERAQGTKATEEAGLALQQVRGELLKNEKPWRAQPVAEEVSDYLTKGRQVVRSGGHAVPATAEHMTSPEQWAKTAGELQESIGAALDKSYDQLDNMIENYEHLHRFKPARVYHPRGEGAIAARAAREAAEQGVAAKPLNPVDFADDAAKTISDTAETGAATADAATAPLETVSTRPASQVLEAATPRQSPNLPKSFSSVGRQPRALLKFNQDDIMSAVTKESEYNPSLRAFGISEEVYNNARNQLLDVVKDVFPKTVQGVRRFSDVRRLRNELYKKLGEKASSLGLGREATAAMDNIYDGVNSLVQDEIEGASKYILETFEGSPEVARQMTGRLKQLGADISNYNKLFHIERRIGDAAAAAKKAAAEAPKLAVETGTKIAPATAAREAFLKSGILNGIGYAMPWKAKAAFWLLNKVRSKQPGELSAVNKLTAAAANKPLLFEKHAKLMEDYLARGTVAGLNALLARQGQEEYDALMQSAEQQEE